VRTTALALLSLAGCINEFQGSNVQIDMATTTPAQVSPGLTPAPDELPSNIHFTLYAYDERVDKNGVSVGSLFEVQRFEVHHIVDLDSPCYIDVGEHVPFPGLHVSQYAAQMAVKTGIPDYRNPPPGATEEQQIDIGTAVQRQSFVARLAADDGPKVLTTVSTGGYGAVAANCTDTNGIPPPSCTDDAANARRLEMCQAAWNKDPQLYEGTDRILTAPLNGKTQGFVIGTNPANGAPIGGAQFFVDEALENFDSFAIYWQYDDADKDGMADYPTATPLNERTELGELLLYGDPTKATRGVIHSHMISPVSPSISAELAIFANIDEDDVHF
jgi:hypothetical protein